jgi:DNA-binding SARP family transcriptional activator
MACLSLHMLGPIQVSLDGQPVNGFESCKARALLAYLVIEANRPHQRSYIASLLWPDLCEAAALGNLRHTLANLRRILHDHDTALPFLRADHHCLQFDNSSDHYTDVVDLTGAVERHRHGPANIEQLERVIDMHRGDFLEGLAVDGCAEFEEWVLLRRESCNWHLMTALYMLCDLYERAHEFDKAICCAKQMVRREPWDEVAHQKLMRAYALCGHRGDALRQYAECRQLLLAELQVEPGPATTALYERIRDGAFPDIALEQPLLLTQPDYLWDRQRTVSRSRMRVELQSARPI